jgi:hypothetical protein
MIAIGGFGGSNSGVISGLDYQFIDVDTLIFPTSNK